MPEANAHEPENRNMATLTLQLPDDKPQRPRALARGRHTTINRLMDEVTTLMLAEFDTKTRFKLRSARGTGTARSDALIFAGLVCSQALGAAQAQAQHPDHFSAAARAFVGPHPGGGQRARCALPIADRGVAARKGDHRLKPSDAKEPGHDRALLAVNSQKESMVGRDRLEL